MQKATTVKPLCRLSTSTSKCLLEGTVYANCILQHMDDIQKDMCSAQFMAFKDCVTKNVMVFFSRLMNQFGRQW